MESYQQMAILALVSIITGYGLFYLILKMLPYLEKRENLTQRAEVLKEAKKQQKSIMRDAADQADEHETLVKEELEASIAQRKEDIQAEEEELNSREQFFNAEEKRLEKIEASLNEKQRRIAEHVQQKQAKQREFEQKRSALVKKLEQATDQQSTTIAQNFSNQILEERQLDCQKVLKSLQEEINSSARKRAQKILDRVHTRYAPGFIWPKNSNVVEVINESDTNFLVSDECKLITDLAEISGSSIQIIGGPEENKKNCLIKVAGGYGIYREAARATLDEIIPNGRRSWNNPEQIYLKHKQKLEAEAVVLGRKAVNELKLPNIHPEVQKLIGALNWRTSYRQNQWYHTVEVAILAGIIGAELGVDPQDAKRVGLLHDIGKAIDYRIEGSHAVISGDYADRFGENRMICDTVMSHHSDLLVETPLAYVLRAADTLSGARPGARVNLEEGYQIRLDAIAEVVHSFEGIADLAIMNGGREVHVQVNHKKVRETEVKKLTQAIATKIEEQVAYPGQIKVSVSRAFESSSVA